MKKLLYKIFIGLFLALFAIAVSLEVVLRIQDKHPVADLQYNKNTIWRFNTNLEDINRSGFRDREHKKTKKAEVKRIMILGDSYAAGVRIEEDKVFPRLIGRKIEWRESGSI